MHLLGSLLGISNKYFFSYFLQSGLLSVTSEAENFVVKKWLNEILKKYWLSRENAIMREKRHTMYKSPGKKKSYKLFIPNA